MVGLPDGKQIKDMFGGVDRIPACDRRTDILRRHSPRYAYASRGKKWVPAAAAAAAAAGYY